MALAKGDKFETMGRKSGSKRQASLDARKQILKVRGDYLELSDDDDDDEVVEITEAPKKYKVTARKSDGERNVLRIVRDTEPTLDLEVWSDELSPAQLAARKNTQQTREIMQNALEDYIKQTDGRILTNTPTMTVLELPQFFQNESLKRGVSAAAPASPSQRPGPGRPAKRPFPGNTTTIVLDTRPTATLGNTVTLTTTTQPGVKRVEAPVPKKKAFLKTYGSATTASAPPLVPIIRTELPPVTQPSSPAQVVDLTSDDNTKSGADSKEVSFNKLQGKTFPSLVVVARPSLRVASEGFVEGRIALDRKVKKILLLSPRNFVEHLIREGLIKSEHYCQTHPTTLLKLGIYSDATRFPNSGGYIWISECCPPKFISVFQESIFEGNYAPTTNYKLIYHWACQTNVQNVLQWVKVENIYLKLLYTYLRGVCTVALHTHMEPLGGKGQFVEVGVISLGTTTQDGANRHVKVEVLGVLDQFTKRVMLKAIDPIEMDAANKAGKKRLNKILEPLLEWVDPESTLIIDMTIEKNALHGIGFANVVRSAGVKSNQTIMDYLRRIVPRMFQNTLSLLSRQIIQQFLDELVWREIYGTNSNETFTNIINHISEQTRADTGVSLFARLNKVAINPFKNWSLATALKKPEPRKIKKPTPPLSLPSNLIKTLSTYTQAKIPQIPKQMVSLEPYYYGTIECNTPSKEIELNVNCPMCNKTFTSNVEIMLHVFKHVSNADYFCKYCLTDCMSKHNLYTHLELKHAIETKAGRFFSCLICHDKFNSVIVLGKHMSIEHSPSELPYHCGVCLYKSSSHKGIIDHFYNKHKNHNMLQCPFCLSDYDIMAPADSMTNNVNKYIKHLIAHYKKGKNPVGPVKKCARCDLQFLTKEEFVVHGDKHISYKHEANFLPYPDTKSSYLVPKSLRDNQLKDGAYQNSPVTLDLDDSYKCKECDKKMNAENHFKNIMFCTKGSCKYQTFCRAAMTSHKVLCTVSQKTVHEHPLSFELFCVCSFSTNDGNAMARHLAICEKKSAYPSSDAAANATVTPGMLDVLGLVRRLEDSKVEDEPKPRSTREPPKRKRKWRLSDASGDEDPDDPDYEVSDEELRNTFKKKKADETSEKTTVPEEQDSPPAGTDTPDKEVSDQEKETTEEVETAIIQEPKKEVEDVAEVDEEAEKNNETTENVEMQEGTGDNSASNEEVKVIEEENPLNDAEIPEGEAGKDAEGNNDEGNTNNVNDANDIVETENISNENQAQASEQVEEAMDVT